MLKNKQPTGFTIVELLIVIVVIGILAAITIVAYNGIQNRANDTTVQSDLRNLLSKLEMFHVDNGRYPNSTAELNTLKVSVNTSTYDITQAYNLPYCTTSATAGFAIAGLSKSGNKFFISSASKSPRSYTGTLDGIPASSDCSSLLAGSTRSITAGYNSGEATLKWRTWVTGG